MRSRCGPPLGTFHSIPEMSLEWRQDCSNKDEDVSKARPHSKRTNHVAVCDCGTRFLVVMFPVSGLCWKARRTLETDQSGSELHVFYPTPEALCFMLGDIAKTRVISWEHDQNNGVFVQGAPDIWSCKAGPAQPNMYCECLASLFVLFLFDCSFYIHAACGCASHSFRYLTFCSGRVHHSLKLLFRENPLRGSGKLTWRMQCRSWYSLWMTKQARVHFI